MPATTVRNIHSHYPCHQTQARFTPSDNQKAEMSRTCPVCKTVWTITRERGKTFNDCRIDTLHWRTAV